MFSYVLITFGIFCCVSAQVSDEEIKNLEQYMHGNGKNCFKDYGIDKSMIAEAKKNKDMSNVDPCLFACIFKENHVINDEGKFDNKESLKIAEKFFANADEVAKVKKVGENCSSVNDAEVSDGDKGCERAIMILRCFVENKAKIM